MSHMIFAPTGLLRSTPLRRALHAALAAEVAADRLEAVKKSARPVIRREMHHRFKQTGERAAR
jgi:hypothetical protein